MTALTRIEGTMLVARNQRKAATRAALLEAGQKLVEQRGAHATQIGDITRAAGVAHGTFYVHFESKDALLDELWAMFEEALEQNVGKLIEQSQEDQDEQLLTSIASGCLDHWRAHRGLVRALAERAAARSDLQLMRPQVCPALAIMMTALLERLGGTTVPPTLVAQGIVGMWMRIGMLYALGGDNAPTREHALEALVSSTLGIVRPLLRKAS